MLLNYGADVRLKDKLHKTAYDDAQENPHILDTDAYREMEKRLSQ